MTNNANSNRYRPYLIENMQPHSGERTRPYEIEEFEGSPTLEGVKSGLRDTARMIPNVSKAYTEAKKSEEKSTGSFVAKAISKVFPRVDATMKGGTAIYDMVPEYFSKSHKQVKAEEGTPLPKSVTESKRYKIGEFIGMEIPFAPIDFLSGGGTAIARHGLRPVVNNSLKRLAMKSTYSHAAYRGTAQAGKNIVAGSVAQELQERGALEWASNLVGIGTGHYAVPKAVDKSGTYLLNKATDYVMKKQAKTAPFNITPTWANTSDGALSEIALGVLQKDMTTRNVMRDFVATQDKEFKDSLLTIIDTDTAMTADAESFLVNVLETKSDVIAKEELALAEQEKSLGDQTNAIQLENKAARTQADDTQEAVTSLLEESQQPKMPNIQPQRSEITERATSTLPDTEVEVSDQLIANAARKASAAAKTPQDQQAAEILNSIPVATESPTRVVEEIYDGISPRIGQPEAGELYKARREQAYALATQEKRALYGDLANAARESRYVITEQQFQKFLNQIDEQISSLEKLPFQSPQQGTALRKLQNLRSAFEIEGKFFDFGDGITTPITDVPNITAMWEARKSFGQSINWKSNLPAEKRMRELYHKFNTALERELRNAGLLNMYNAANEMYTTRFLPLEQGTNGRVRFLDPQQAGRILNLNAIEGLGAFLPLEDLNPLRRYAIERVVGLPKTGQTLATQTQKLANVRRYLTPSEQAQFNSLADIELIKARVSIKQLEKIENYLEANRDKLSPDVISSLERVADELRASADLPVEYITGRAQLAELEAAQLEQYEQMKGEHKAQKIALKREARSARREARNVAERNSDKQKQINELLKDVAKRKKSSALDRKRLEKSLLGTILQSDTNKALLTQMSSPDGIKEVKELFGESPTGKSIFEALKLRKAQQIFENAASISSIVKLLKNESSRLLLKTLLPADNYAKLVSLSELAANMQTRLRYFINSSNTEVQRSNLQTFKEMMSGVMSLFTRGLAEGTGRLIAKTLVPSSIKIAAAKLLTEPKALSALEKFFRTLKSTNDLRLQGKVASDLMSVIGKLMVNVAESANDTENDNERQHAKPRVSQ